MKTVIIESNNPLSWYFIADSALINAGKPFFIPEFADEFEAFLAPVVRISRIGKSIASRFAGRYYEEIAPAIHFRASALRRQLLEAGLPADPSHSFDRSMTVGSFIPAEKMLSGAPLVMELSKSTSITDRHLDTEAAPIPTGETADKMEGECPAEELRESVGPILESVS